ncbi:MAG TPA: nucleoside-diphosphate sugar epimerase/dehydratase [Candidatus Baltobacteraceae bacterium]|nr:nucleoside-diphosphate sugar epimerase/dehydratase [Candidatus Baltobacteraceae bacterium]
MSTLNGRPRAIRPLLRAALLIADCALIGIALLLAPIVGDIHSASPEQLGMIGAIFLVSGCYVQFRYESARTFDFYDVVRLLVGATAGAVLALLCEVLPTPLQTASGRLVIIVATLSFVLRMFSRIGLVVLRIWWQNQRPEAKRVLIVGHGIAAHQIAKSIFEDRRVAMRVVGCVEDGVSERRVDGVRVLGKLHQLPELLRKHAVDTVIVAIVAAPLWLINEIKELCTHVPAERRPSVTVVPDAADVLSDRVTVSRMRDIRLEDVLHREPVVIDTAGIRPHLEGQVVLVTGAGGSIGSEICRQIAAFDPALLVLLGHGENSLFSIERELHETYKFCRSRMVLADVADVGAIRHVFSTYKPRVVLHAAAHKHVPIVEDNVCEAIRNNVFGTKVVALAAAASGAAKFILLSTDKAVNPSSVMGATKRMAELICQSFAGGSATEFVSVRFGNVLGSRGSVVPIFKAQVQSGGPVTITHRDMVRYFMTIPEAVSLVLQAMSMGMDGEVFVLDMGLPIRILDLAEQVVRLSGLEPYRDIDIVESGVRPGEKLFEEILTDGEGFTRTAHERLFIAKQERLDYAHLNEGVDRLRAAVRRYDTAGAIATLREFVPEYTPLVHAKPAPDREGAQVPAQQRFVRVERAEIAPVMTTRIEAT